MPRLSHTTACVWLLTSEDRSSWGQTYDVIVLLSGLVGYNFQVLMTGVTGLANLNLLNNEITHIYNSNNEVILYIMYSCILEFLKNIHSSVYVLPDRQFVCK